MKFWQTMLGRQFRRPQGLLGSWAARVMEKRNQEYYERIVTLLDLQGSEAVLEIGYGTGRAIARIVKQQPDCLIHGIDFSPLMRRRAQRNNRAAVAAGRVSLQLGDFLTFDFGGRRFDKIFFINVIYFWEDLRQPLAKINRLLVPGGRLVFYMSGPERLRNIRFAVDSVFKKYTLNQVESALRAAGLSDIEIIRFEKQGSDCYCISARKRSGRGKPGRK